MTFRIELVSGPSAVIDFSEVPFHIREKRYQAGLSSPEWTRELLGYEFKFKRAHWIVHDDTRIVGRIGANVSERDPSRGYLGFYEVSLEHPEAQEIHDLLISTGEKWLREQQVVTAYGPIDYVNWFPYRFRTDAPEGTPDFKWEPLQPPGYPDLWVKSHYHPTERYTSRSSDDLAKASVATRPYYDRCWEAGFRTRPFHTDHRFPNELPIIQGINRRAFEAGALSEPIDAEAYAKFYASQFLEYIGKYCFFALNPSGEEIGYFFIYGDQEHFIWKTVAVAAEYQRLGVGAFGMHHGVSLALRDGFKHSIAALVKEGAPSEGLTSKPTSYEWSHEYTLYKKTL